jgi:beta-N-acetylhexosaminidase
MNADAVGCVLKHFPGYGNNSDTHTGSSYDSRPYETFLTRATSSV